ncbi:putative ankyrin repeat-containing domain, PGG domain, ankyrin repeat-containing domain superfamily [Helianthus annuus]|nr:putative ankyrin repeat-containing domain, PGG domain, ankyrin repeat-containing domain superfamily [Helianthus annuus]KAJ0624084.1 putative ankyrin repeat-containing domain, PGG domain, ankyrin repeat-containing domain superfamily [Helianthus annuus]KAJ0784219.1 putative ankyrin repeat-containing domain, PGG domain, ankyrin repeat-containing domain superfamily [Helianthus annuus]KAJ0793424.1 putative ankyrin repeat-containing domain, PGG domain, ankyrin repeat-containing domain superfamily [
MEKQISFRLGKMEKQQSFRVSAMEKQKSFRISMGRQMSFGVDRKKAKDSPGKRGDSVLHLACRGGNLSKVIEILQSLGLDALSKQNQEGETPLYVAAENGHVHVVGQFLKHLDLQTASIAANNGYDPFHIAAKQGHLEVLRELLNSFPNLVMTTDSSNSTALHTASAQGHVDVVNLLLDADSNLAKIARNNGKTVLHTAARMGHLEVAKSVLNKDPSIGFRNDKKGQTALHMAVKGQNMDMVVELIKPDPTVLSLEDNKGNTALHIATKKGRTKIVKCLLSFEDINVNAVNKAGETPLDIAENVKITELINILKEAGAAHSKDYGKPPSAAKQLKQTVSDIKHDVQSQIRQTRNTGFRVRKIAKKVKKLHISGLNNAINSATVVAVLIATVAFAAIFTIPGQYVEEKKDGFTLGQANIATNAVFIMFFLFDSLALFISLAVVVVQTSIVVIEEKAKRQLMFVINKLMWLACLFISIAFISLTYVVVGSHERWLAVYATVIGATVMLTTIGSMCYCVVRHRLEETKMRNIRRAETNSHSYSMSMASDPEIYSEKYKRMYAV